MQTKQQALAGFVGEDDLRSEVDVIEDSILKINVGEKGKLRINEGQTDSSDYDNLKDRIRLRFLLEEEGVGELNVPLNQGFQG